jgi:tRNA(Ile)-lysidine synthase
MLIDRVFQFVLTHNMFGEMDRVLVALSGGPDSVALAALLSDIRQKRWSLLKIHLAHLNHQLRGDESLRDQEFVREFAREFGLDLTVEQADVAEIAAHSGQNLEAVARRLRYQFLQRAAAQAQAQCIATGHSINDQAETVLMRLLRGTGAAGLVGIYPVVEPAAQENPRSEGISNWIKIRVVRPLLGIKRDEIEKYLEDRGLQACLDSSNLKPQFTRNKIRLEILPRLLDINPRAIEAIARTAELLREEFVLTYQQFEMPEQKNESLTGSQKIEMVAGTEKLSADILSNCLPGLRRKYIREAIGRARGDLRRITAAHVEAIESLLESNKSGKRIGLPGGYEVAREFNNLIIRPATETESVPQDKDKDKGEELLELSLNDNCRTELFRLSFLPADTVQAKELDKSGRLALVDLDLTGERLKIRRRLPGDRYQPIGHKRREKLKNLMIENRIPLSQRRAWPIIIKESGEIIWTPCLPVADAFAPRSTTDRLAVIKAE